MQAKIAGEHGKARLIRDTVQWKYTSYHATSNETSALKFGSYIKQKFFFFTANSLKCLTIFHFHNSSKYPTFKTFFFCCSNIFY